MICFSLPPESLAQRSLARIVSSGAETSTFIPRSFDAFTSKAGSIERLICQKPEIDFLAIDQEKEVEHRLLAHSLRTASSDR